MGSTFREDCSRVLVILLDVIYLALGAGILGIGVWLTIDPNADDLRVVLATFLGDELSDQLVYAFLGIGGVIVAIAFLGLLSVAAEKAGLFGVFACLLVVLMGVEVAVAVLSQAHKEDIYSDINERMNITIKRQFYHNDSFYAVTDAGLAWNFLQWRFDCCGAYNYTDYLPTFPEQYGIPFPFSCCQMLEDADGERALVKDAVDYMACVRMKEGYFRSDACYDVVRDASETGMVVVLGVAAGLAGFTLILLLLVICLCVSTMKHIGYDDDEDEEEEDSDSSDVSYDAASSIKTELGVFDEKASNSCTVCKKCFS